MTTTEKNRLIAAIETSSLSSEHRAQIVELIETLTAKEDVVDVENQVWNPYTDPCYAAQEKWAADRENAQMQAQAGWHHVPERMIV